MKFTLAVLCALLGMAVARSWGIFRDRRPDLYGAIGTLDGGNA